MYIRSRLAIHEAGHAVANFLTGRKIGPDHRSRGSCASGATEDVFNAVVALMAPHAYEEAFGSEPSGDRFDADEIEDTAAKRIGGGEVRGPRGAVGGREQAGAQREVRQPLARTQSSTAPRRGPDRRGSRTDPARASRAGPVAHGEDWARTRCGVSQGADGAPEWSFGEDSPTPPSARSAPERRFLDADRFREPTPARRRHGDGLQPRPSGGVERLGRRVQAAGPGDPGRRIQLLRQANPS